MATPKPHSNLPSRAHLRDALSQIGREIDDRPLRTSALARIMRETFGGNDASGAWSWRMAYDIMQAAAAMRIARAGTGDVDRLAPQLASRLLTETRRSEQQFRLQQF